MANKNSTSSRRRKKRRQQETETGIIDSSKSSKMAVSNHYKDTRAAPSQAFLLFSWRNIGIVAVLIALLFWTRLHAFFQGGSSSVDNTMAQGTHHRPSETTPPSVITTSTTASRQAQYPHLDGVDYRVLQVLPHDTTAFTQGLTYFNASLYESTGYHGQSKLRRLDPNSGRVLHSIDVPSQYFAEGVAHFTNYLGQECLIQLTWEELTGFIYIIKKNGTELELVQTFSFVTSTGQGWGITYNAHSKEFIVSDGSSWLHVWERDTLVEKRRFQVTMLKESAATQSTTAIPIRHLNELEWDSKRAGGGDHDGGSSSGTTILANVWYTDVIVRISLDTGRIEHIYRFDNLYTNRTEEVDCFNGIALISNTPGQVFVTGKWWPHMYRIQLLR